MSLIPSRKRPRPNYYTSDAVSPSLGPIIVGSRPRAAYTGSGASTGNRPEKKYLSKVAQPVAAKPWWNDVNDVNLHWIRDTEVGDDVMDSGKAEGRLYDEGQWILCQNVAAVSRGTEFNRRIGNSIQVKSLQWRLALTGVVNDATCTSYIARMVIAIDQGSNNSPICPRDVIIQSNLDSGHPIGGIYGPPVLAMSNAQNKSRFKIIMDKMEPVSFNGGVEGGVQITHVFDGFKSLNYQQEILDKPDDKFHTLRDNLVILCCLQFLSPLKAISAEDKWNLLTPNTQRNHDASIYTITGNTRVTYTDQ